MIAELEVRKHLVRFLSNEISLDDFEDWLVSKSWDMHQDSAQQAQKLVGAIELRLAEYSESHIDLETLHRELIPFATEVNIFVSYHKAPIVIAASSSVTIAPPSAAMTQAKVPRQWSPILSGT